MTEDTTKLNPPDPAQQDASAPLSTGTSAEPAPAPVVLPVEEGSAAPEPVLPAEPAEPEIRPIPVEIPEEEAVKEQEPVKGQAAEAEDLAEAEPVLPKAEPELKTEPAPPVPPSPLSSQPEPAEIPFIAKFKNKLRELRQAANQKRSQKAEANLRKIMSYAREKQKITNDEVEELTGVGDTQAEKYLKILVKQGRLVRFGKTKNTFYKPIK